ncbi:MAG: twin-arginine translocase subunit TatC [Archaeoglobaceae archaeon]
MEARDLARFLLEIRKNILRIFAIVAIASLLFFPISGKIVSFICEEMYPKAVLSEERVKEIAEELKKIAENLSANSNNTTIVESELKRLSRIEIYFTGPVVLSPLEAIVLSLKISIAVGIASAIPYILLLLSRFLKTRGWLKVKVTYYAIASIALFLTGVIYGFYILHFIIQFLHNLTLSYGVTPLYSLSEFVNFIVFMIALFGFFFEIPVLMLFLVRNGVLKYTTLKYYRRHSYVLFFVLAAIATPTVDIFTQTMLALPMVALFEIGMVLIRFFSPVRS